MPRNRSKIQEALRQRKQNESAAILNQAQAEEAAYQCFFQRDAVPSPIESGVTCLLKLAKLSVFPNHEEYFPLYTGERLADMVESIRRYGVQTPILVWKTAQGKYIIISGHNRVNASIIAGLDTIPAVVRTDLTKENAEDLFFEMNFRQRSLADMVFSQRVLCVAAHYNLVKHQGRRTDLLAKEDTKTGKCKLLLILKRGFMPMPELPRNTNSLGIRCPSTVAMPPCTVPCSCSWTIRSWGSWPPTRSAL